MKLSIGMASLSCVSFGSFIDHDHGGYEYEYEFQWNRFSGVEAFNYHGLFKILLGNSINCSRKFRVEIP